MRFALLAFLLILGSCSPSVEQVASPDSRFIDFVDEFFKATFEHSPTTATAAGFRAFDTRLDDLSAESMGKRIVKLKEFQKQMASFANLSEENTIDAEFLASQISAELYELETLQTWKKNPMGYVSLAGSAVDGLMKRNFAPAKDRLNSVTARLLLVPAALSAMRENVNNPPKEFTDLAIRMAQGSAGFFEKDVATWATAASEGDQAALAKFTAANSKVIADIKSAAEWLKEDLKPRSNGAYAIGAESFSKKLAYEEMVDLPLEKLLEIWEANLEKDYRDFVETAGTLKSSKSPAAVMASLSEEHPSADRLIPATRQTLAGIRKFLVDRRIITLPNDNLPQVQETPPYARNGSFASMDSPGAYETKANEAFYYVTPPEKEWDNKHVEEHLRLYNRPVMDIITIHEAFPGHFTQFLYSRQYPTKIRKLLHASSNAEGWAHYSEQMMVEEGFGNQDPKLKLAQLSEALLRDCRYVAGIKMHTQGMTVEQATKLFMDKGFQERANAFEEARRGSYNPTYLYYTLGKLQIYKLRQDYKIAKGPEYSLQNFHDAFIKVGPLPIKLVRKVLLPTDKGSTL